MASPLRLWPTSRNLKYKWFESFTKVLFAVLFWDSPVSIWEPVFHVCIARGSRASRVPQKQCAIVDQLERTARWRIRRSPTARAEFRVVMGARNDIHIPHKPGDWIHQKIDKNSVGSDSVCARSNNPGIDSQATSARDLRIRIQLSSLTLNIQ